MPILNINNITSGYEKIPVIQDANLHVDEGEIVAVIGHNGVGKTTLMKTVIGLISPMDGTITYFDSDITSMEPNERAKLGMGYVSQKRDIFPRLTVAENLRVGKKVNINKDNNYINEVYEYFPRLDERRTQKAGSMSGGEQQMLAIGRALVGGPDLLLLDEPSEGVQPSIIDEISENIVDIQEDLGTSVIIAEQHLKFINDTAERCYLLERGTIVDEIDTGGPNSEDLLRESLSL